MFDPALNAGVTGHVASPRSYIGLACIDLYTLEEK